MANTVGAATLALVSLCYLVGFTRSTIRHGSAIQQKGLGALSPGARAAAAGTSLDKPGHDEFNLIGKCSNTGITGTVMACGLQVLFGELAKLIRNGPG